MTTKIYFLILLEVKIPRSRCQQCWFLLRPLSLAVDGHLLPVSSYGLSVDGYNLWPNFLFLGGHETGWTRAYPNDLIQNAFTQHLLRIGTKLSEMIVFTRGKEQEQYVWTGRAVQLWIRVCEVPSTIYSMNFLSTNCVLHTLPEARQKGDRILPTEDVYFSHINIAEIKCFTVITSLNGNLLT